MDHGRASVKAELAAATVRHEAHLRHTLIRKALRGCRCSFGGAPCQRSKHDKDVEPTVLRHEVPLLRGRLHGEFVSSPSPKAVSEDLARRRPATCVLFAGLVSASRCGRPKTCRDQLGITSRHDGYFPTHAGPDHQRSPRRDSVCSAVDERRDARSAAKALASSLKA